jgi:hypothetical protein
MDPKDFWGDEQELDLDEIHRHLDKHPVLRLLSYDEVNRGLDRLWKIIEIISFIEDYLLDNENPTLPLPESGSDTEVLESYVWNHKRRWTERDTTIVDDEEPQIPASPSFGPAEIFDAFFEKIRAVPFPEEQMERTKHLQQQPDARAVDTSAQVKDAEAMEVTTKTSSGGGSRLERFSASEQRALALAQEEAKQFNHNYIGTEHILLGLISETEGVAARVLSGLGVDLSKVRSVVEFIIGRGEEPVQGEIGLTPRANKSMDLAVDEARRMNHTYIGTEHLLIGLLREGEGVAAGVLESQGVTLEKVRSATHRL